MGIVSMATAALRRVHALEMRMSRLRGQQVHALAELLDAWTDDPEYDDGSVQVDASGWHMPAESGIRGYAADDLAAWMKWTIYRAEQALDEATRLRDTLPVTLSLLEQGRIDYPRAQVMARAVQVLDATQSGVVDTALAPVIETLTTGALRPAADREVLAPTPALRPADTVAPPPPGTWE